MLFRSVDIIGFIASCITRRFGESTSGIMLRRTCTGWAGVRATIPQQVLVNLPYIFAFSFLDLAPWWMNLAIGAFNSFQNDWMHVNVTWRSNWLEWVVVTPRYHHIHHSDNPLHFKANLAALFTIWDRLFGTYVDPDSIKEPLTFGIGEEVPLVRLAVGV